MYKSNQSAAHAPNQNFSAYKQESFESPPPMDMLHRRRNTDPGYSGSADAKPMSEKKAVSTVDMAVNATVKPKPGNLRPLIIFAIGVLLVDIIAFFF
jgi:hypothetical protein